MAPRSSRGGRLPNRGGGQQNRGGGQRGGAGGRGGRGRGSSNEDQGRSNTVGRQQNGGGRAQEGRSSRSGRRRGRSFARGGVQQSGRGGHGGGGGGSSKRQGRDRQADNSIEQETRDEEEIRDRSPSPWRNSRAKDKASMLLKDESSYVQVLSPYQVYISDPDFGKYKEDNFIRNYKALKERIQTDKDASDFDKFNIAQDLSLHPPNAVNQRGEARYEGSAAEKKLKEAVRDGQSKGVNPRTLWNSAIEFKSLTLKQFRSHKYQEERVLTEGVYWQKKRNDDGRKKHDQEQEKRND